MRRALLGAALTMALGAPALAVGMGPLAKEGITDGPAKAFYLTLYNPYDEPREFHAFATELQSEQADLQDVEIRPSEVRLGAGKQRRILVILRDLTPNTTRSVRVCAELAKQEGLVHARVCSKLSARRLAAR